MKSKDNEKSLQELYDEAKFTKGEWSIRKINPKPLTAKDKNGVLWQHNSMWVHGPDKRVVAYINYSTDTQHMGWGDNETVEKWLGNVSAISAVPDMIEALRLALSIRDLWGAPSDAIALEESFSGELQALSEMEHKIKSALLKALTPNTPSND